MKRSLRVVVLAVLALLLLGPVPNSLARPDTGPRLPVGRNAVTPKVIENPGDGLSAAYATGTVVHADALRNGEHALVDLDVAFSGAAVSQGPAPEAYTNEVHRKVADLVKDRLAYGRGTGVEVGLLGSGPLPLIGQLSEASAPVSTGLIHTFVGPIGVEPLVRAELLRSAALARARTEGCVLGREAGFGLGSVLNLDVLGGLLATTHARPPYREVSQSNSSTRIVRKGGVLGLKSETLQTIAPVTFFKGTPMQFTVEVLGAWVLRAIAYGNDHELHYGPRDISPETPVVRILDAQGKPRFQITTQMLLGKHGLQLELPNVAEISIGEDPRMINDKASSDPLVSDTQVAAAVDVVRVKLFNGQLADVRIGHMEAAVTVPEGGVKKCTPGLNVDQTPDKPTVTPGDEFNYVVKITNPNDCVVSSLKLVEAPTAPVGVKFEIVSTDPPGGNVAGGVATYPDIGPLGPGETKTVTIKVNIPLGSAGGLLRALVVATGVCPDEDQPADSNDEPTSANTPDPAGAIPVQGQDSVDGPNVDVCVVPDVKGKTLAEAVEMITKAGCVANPKDGGPGDPDDKGKVTDQKTPPGTEVRIGTPIEITIGGPGCNPPSVIGETIKEAAPLLEKAGCKLGDVTTGTDGGSGSPGTIQTQNPPAGGRLPFGTEVDVALVPGGGATFVAASTNCTVPGLVGMSEADARTKVEAAGCVLVTEPKNTSKAEDLGKVLTQEPGANTVLPRGSPVKVQLGVQVLGSTETKAQQEVSPAGLARTGGLFLGGLSLWLLLGGVLARLAGSHRLWRLARRRG